MNAVKAREWWRPTAPMLLAEHVGQVFAEPELVHSPYMSFAARLRPEMREKAPAIWHFDGTARPQTVRREDEPWLHALLTEVARQSKTGLGILINTSFNTKGQPMVSRAGDAICLLCELYEKGLDYVLIDDFLFEREGACRVCTAEARARISESIIWP